MPEDIQCRFEYIILDLRRQDPDLSYQHMGFMKDNVKETYRMKREGKQENVII